MPATLIKTMPQIESTPSSIENENQKQDESNPSLLRTAAINALYTASTTALYIIREHKTFYFTNTTAP